jgi:type II secretory pathway predicted ATPase ExeA
MINDLIDNMTLNINSEKDIFESENFKLAMAFIHHSIKYKKFIAITGDTGSGKTYLMRCLFNLSNKDKSLIVCSINNQDFDKVRLRQIYEAILFDIQDIQAKRSTEALIRQVRHILSALYKENKKVVLIVDEAHRINKNTLLALKNVWESSYGFSRLISIILIGQKKLSVKLNEPNNKEINNRIEQMSIQSINSSNECQKYIKHIAETNNLNINCIDKSAYNEIAKRQSTFLGVKQLLKDVLIIAKNAGSDNLNYKHFKHI